MIRRNLLKATLLTTVIATLLVSSACGKNNNNIASNIETTQSMQTTEVSKETEKSTDNNTNTETTSEANAENESTENNIESNVENAEVVVISARVEEEISELDDEDKEMFLEDLGLTESGVDKLTRAAYHLLGLGTYFTAGEKEVRAWTFKRGIKAPQAAGIIHSDFEKGFIRAVTMSYDDLIKYGSEKAVKEAGRLREEGKEYVVQDGDIMEFRFNV